MSYLGPKEVVDNALNENTEDPAFVAGARVLAETKSHISEGMSLNSRVFNHILPCRPETLTFMFTIP